MTGINYRDGSWVDAIGPICSRFDSGAKRFVGEIANLPMVGGRGGVRDVQRCDTSRGVVTQLVVTQARNHDRSVGSIRVICGDYLNPGQRVGVRYTGDLHNGFLIGREGIGESHLPCPPPLVAGGLHGMSGAFVDRVGITCVDYQPR